MKIVLKNSSPSGFPMMKAAKAVDSLAMSVFNEAGLFLDGNIVPRLFNPHEVI